MTGITLFLVLTGKISIITAANFLVAFLYPFFIFFIALVFILTELPNRKIRFLSLGLILSFIAASIGYSIKSRIHAGMGIDITLPYVLFVSAIELCLLYVFIFLWSYYMKIPPKSGAESMIGQQAIVTYWKGKHGRIKHNGESWKATSTNNEILRPEQVVIIKSIYKLTLTVDKVEQNNNQNSTKKK